MAFLLGNAYNTYEHYDFSHSTDAKNYVRMAQGDYDVLVTHRYRIAIPTIAGGISATLKPIFMAVWPEKGPTKALQLSFFLINLSLMSAFGLILFATTKLFVPNYIALLSTLILLMSRWANYSTALPLVDSFYLCCIALACYGMLANKLFPLLLGVAMGLLSKESFLLYWPALFIFHKGNISLKLGAIALSICLVFGVHYYVNKNISIVQPNTVANALSHWYNIHASLKRLLSIGGIGELCTILGLFSLIPFWGLITWKKSTSIIEQLPLLCWYLLLVGFVQALISTSIARMLYTAAPFWCILIAVLIAKHPHFYWLKKLQSV